MSVRATGLDLRPRGVNESQRSYECGTRWVELGNIQGRVDDSDPYGRIQDCFKEEV